MGSQLDVARWRAQYFFFNDTATTEIYTMRMSFQVSKAQACSCAKPVTIGTGAQHKVQYTLWTRARLESLKEFTRVPALDTRPRCCYLALDKLGHTEIIEEVNVNRRSLPREDACQA